MFFDNGFKRIRTTKTAMHSVQCSINLKNDFGILLDIRGFYLPDKQLCIKR